MGIGRTLSDLLSRYTEIHRDTPPTQSIDTLKRWSSKYSWSERTIGYDTTWEERKNEERNHVFNMELALDYGRVKKLIRLADMLEEQIYEQGENGDLHNVWLPDVKQIGSGEWAERVDIERFNGALISEYRATLDDISKEVGGRIRKQELTGAGGGAILWSQVMQVDPDETDDPFA